MFMNSIELEGRLTMDPELKQTPANKSVVKFTIACNRKHNLNLTDFIDCIAWEKKAETICKYCHKGDQLIIFGELETNNYKNNDDKMVKSTYVRVDSIAFGNKSNGISNFERKEPILEPKYIEIDEDVDLPF